jgi:glycosyltransferase involved in cell wall biosynthesis
MFHVIKHLSHRFDVTLLSLTEEPKVPDLGPVTDWCQDVKVVPGVLRRDQAILRSVLSLKPYRAVRFWTPQFQAVCDMTLAKTQFEVIWVNFLNMMIHLLPTSRISGVTVLDQHNADERLWKQYVGRGPILHRLFSRWNLIKVRRLQRQELSKVDIVASVSREEADFMRSRAPARVKIWVVPNGVDTTYFQPDLSGQKKNNILMFCGSMDVTMNVDAVYHFADDIFPLIKQQVRDAEFWIVGRNPGKKVRQLAALEGIRVTGEVADVRPFYRKAKVSVAPFRFGAGTKLKILESMAMGVPVVSTSSGCYGIEVGEGVKVRDHPGQFADAVAQQLLDQPSSPESMLAIRKLVTDKYDWGTILEPMGENLAQEALQKHRQ